MSYALIPNLYNSPGRGDVIGLNSGLNELNILVVYTVKKLIQFIQTTIEHFELNRLLFPSFDFFFIWSILQNKIAIGIKIKYFNIFETNIIKLFWKITEIFLLKNNEQPSWCQLDLKWIRSYPKLRYCQLIFNKIYY